MNSQDCRVLVVDDVPMITRLYGLLLSKRGYQVQTVNDSRTALQAVRDFRPKAVLLDINMPYLSGYEVAVQIRKEHGFEALPIIAITSHDDDAHLGKAQQAGIDHSLVKPCNFDEVEKLLDEFCKD